MKGLDGGEEWPVVTGEEWQMELKFSPCCLPPIPPLEFSNRFTLRACWPPVSPDSESKHLLAESASGEGEFIVFSLDFWEMGMKKGLEVSTGLTKHRISPQFFPHSPNKASSCTTQDWKGRPGKQDMWWQQVSGGGVGRSPGQPFEGMRNTDVQTVSLLFSRRCQGSRKEAFSQQG